MKMENTIQKFIEPIKKDECRKLGIPENFIFGVHGYRKELLGGFCEPIIENGKLIAVDIGIDEEKKSIGMKKSFFHEIKHAQQYFKYGYEEVHHINPVYYELEATLYEHKRYLEECIHYISKKLKQCIISLISK